MGKQSARLYYDGKDNKDIYFQGNYHMAMYKGGQLVWKKITEGKHIPYIFKEGNNLVLKVLYVEGRTTVTVGNSKKFVANDDHLVRGENMVGFVVNNGQIVYSKDGETFQAIEGGSKNEGNYVYDGRQGASYSSQINNFVWIRRKKYGDTFIYDVVDTDTETSETKTITEGVGADTVSSRYASIISGIINPNLNKLAYLMAFSGGNPPYERAIFIEDRVTRIIFSSYRSGAPYLDLPTTFMGSDGKYAYIYVTRYGTSLGITKERRYCQKLNIEKKEIFNPDTMKEVTDSDMCYECIKSSLYKNGKFIVYCSVNGKLEIYTTNDFLEFTKISANRSISMHDISSGKDIILSFDSEVSGDWYIQPYCNLDNTYYFDENGIMHENDGCLLCSIDENAEAGTAPRRAMFYFDNFYFRESEGNFCEISN